MNEYIRSLCKFLLSSIKILALILYHVDRERMMHSSVLHQLISERIQREGPIPFAAYMRMALYEPGYGYYVTGSAKMGWQGDYYTSTDVSTLFANCMGRQLHAMWEQLKCPSHFIVLEQGAGRGHLAEGVRAWALKEARAFHTALDYRTEHIHAGRKPLDSKRPAPPPALTPPPESIHPFPPHPLTTPPSPPP